MNTTNASSFFQSADTQAKLQRQAAKAANKLGNLINFSTKILHLSNDLNSDRHVLLSESGSVARRVNIETGSTEAIYRGHNAPVTAIIDLGDGRVVTGSWDKTIRIFDKASRQCLRVLEGHADFIKCLTHVPALNLLLSGSSDSQIRAWSLSDYKCAYLLKGHARGVECLALAPGNVLYSGGSESSIRRWSISETSGREEGEASWIHQTSVYALLYDEDTESLWSAGADRTARQLTIDAKGTLVEEAVYEHPDYVRQIAVSGGRLITACRDEHIRLFDIGSGKLLYTLQGHFSEVSGLVIAGNTLVSTSLDATLRRWQLNEKGMQGHIEEQKAWAAAAAAASSSGQDELTTDEMGMTADELAELEELM